MVDADNALENITKSFGLEILKQVLHGERIARIELQNFSFRFVLTQPIGDQACPFVDGGRAAIEAFRYRDDDGAAVGHEFKPALQKQRLFA